MTFLAMRSPSMLAALVSAIALVTPILATDYHDVANSKSYRSARACTALKTTLPDQVYYPNSTIYDTESSFNWDIRSALTPFCVFLPSSPQEVAIGVRILTTAQAEFAVRSGGHTPVPGWANTNGGILIALSNLENIEFSKSDKVLKVGPGALWGNVYRKAAEKGMFVIGGRLYDIGVAGLALGGGLNYLSGRYGLACDNVVGFEVVTANGKVIYATAKNEHRNLFKALKGGSGNFGIVTRFDLTTYPLGDIWGGIAQFDVINPATMDKYLTILNEYHHTGTLDLDSGMIPSIASIPSYGMVIAAPAFFYAKPVNGTAKPKVFEDFWTLEESSSTIKNTNLSTLAAEFSAGLPRASGRQTFRVGAVVASKESLAYAVSGFVEESAKLVDIPNFNSVLTLQPIPKSLIQAGIDNGGNVLGLDISKAPYSWIIVSTTWSKSENDERVSEYEQNVINRYTSWAKEKGYGSDYIYLNDAGAGQPVFEGYGKQNVDFLKSVRAKYDPKLVFTKLMPGGFKF